MGGYTSIVINQGRIDIVRVARGKGRSTRRWSIEVPQGVLSISSKIPNVLDREGLVDTLQGLKKKAGVRRCRITLSLPDIVVRVGVFEVEELPCRKEDILRLIKWRMGNSFLLSSQDILADFVILERQGRGGRVLGVACSRDIIVQYEDIFYSVGLIPEVINLHTFHLLNLSSPSIKEGDSILLTRLEGFSTMLILRDYKIDFYRYRRGGLWEEGLRDISIALYHYMKGRPDASLKRIYLYLPFHGCGTDTEERAWGRFIKDVSALSGLEVEVLEGIGQGV